MLYALLCYNHEDTVFAWTKDQTATVMTRLEDIEARLRREGRLRSVARLMPTSAATTLRKDTDPPLVLDGPFAETKESLLGFFIIDCAGLEEALEITGELGRANPGGAYEVRPLMMFRDGAAAP